MKRDVFQGNLGMRTMRANDDVLKISVHHSFPQFKSPTVFVIVFVVNCISEGLSKPWIALQLRLVVRW